MGKRGRRKTKTEEVKETKTEDNGDEFKNDEDDNIQSKRRKLNNNDDNIDTERKDDNDDNNNDEDEDEITSQYSYSMVCASNMNRSMAAHVELANEGFDVTSYGAGSSVKFPGVDPKNPKKFPFGTRYEEMYNIVKEENEAAYVKNGMIKLLKRGMDTKPAPQKWQDEETEVLSDIDVVICFENRIYDNVLNDLQSREPINMEPIHVFCMDIKDNAKGAAQGAQLSLELARNLDDVEDLIIEIPEILDRINTKYGKEDLLRYEVCFI